MPGTFHRLGQTMRGDSVSSDSPSNKKRDREVDVIEKLTRRRRREGFPNCVLTDLFGRRGNACELWSRLVYDHGARALSQAGPVAAPVGRLSPEYHLRSGFPQAARRPSPGRGGAADLAASSASFNAKPRNVLRETQFLGAARCGGARSRTWT